MERMREGARRIREAYERVVPVYADNVEHFGELSKKYGITSIIVRHALEFTPSISGSSWMPPQSECFYSSAYFDGVGGTRKIKFSEPFLRDGSPRTMQEPSHRLKVLLTADARAQRLYELLPDIAIDIIDDDDMVLDEKALKVVRESCKNLGIEPYPEKAR